MKNKKTISFNYIMNMVLMASSVLFPLITFPYVSRVLTPDGIGRVSFAISFVNYFSLFAQLGIPTYGVRVCAQVRDDREALTRTAQELLIISLFMNIISYAGLFAAITFIPKIRSDKSLYIVLGFTIILTSVGVEWLYKALEEYAYITIRSVAFKLIAFTSMFFLIREEKDYVIYGGLTIFAASASNICNILGVHRYISLKPIGGYNFKRHMKPVMTFFAMTCATTIYTNLDNVMLGFMSSDAEVGYYSAAVKIKNMLSAVVTSLGTVILPRASYYVEKGLIDEFKKISSKAVGFVCIMAVPLSVYFTAWAYDSIMFLSGEAFAGAVIPMQIVMPTVFLIGITNILGIQILVPLGREKVVLYSVSAGAIADLILNSLLIPMYGANGAAIGTLVAEVVVLIFQVISLKADISVIISNVHLMKICIGCIISLALSLLGGSIIKGYFIRLCVSAMLFFTAYSVYLMLIKDSIMIEILDRILRKIKSSDKEYK